ncbi:SDR family oxidoreductase [Chondrinema litorale]|uniref:SDR family oxidoreductase n=1 Tax=Chondrinema litorale TaxID=2994555 RepID=UPI0025435A6A|nr:NAD(P)H-binding protein [Chondrinema litorale]UZR92960.1 NAD(P)H-binding protein [Chondrinema litorale]
MLHNILVIGATGNFGLPVTRALVEHGLEVTAFVRNPEKAARVLPADVALIQGDLKDKDSIERALIGHDAVYLNLSVSPAAHKKSFHTEKEGIRNLLEAARFSGIQRVFYLSSLLHQSTNNKWWVSQIKRDAVRLLNLSELPVTIFYSTLFMESVPKIMTRKKRLYLPKNTDRKFFWIAIEDYAQQAATAIKANSFLYKNIEYTIQGLEKISFKTVSQTFLRAHPEIQTSKTSTKLLKPFTFLHPKLSFFTYYLEILSDHNETFNAEKTWEELGKPEITFNEFANKVKNKLHSGNFLS